MKNPFNRNKEIVEIKLLEDTYDQGPLTNEETRTAQILFTRESGDLVSVAHVMGLSTKHYYSICNLFDYASISNLAQAEIIYDKEPYEITVRKKLRVPSEEEIKKWMPLDYSERFKGQVALEVRNKEQFKTIDIEE